MNKRKYIAAAVSVAAVLAFCLFLFMNSAQDGNKSAEASGFFVNLLTPLLEFFGIEADTHALSFFVRKSAHFLGYFAFGLLLCFIINRFCKIKGMIFLAPTVAFFVALCDEFLVQASTDGRSPEWRDVIIDISGAMLAAAVFALAVFLKSKKERNRNDKA